MSTQIQSQDLEGGVVAPGNSKYYGTDGTGAKGFFDFPSSSSAGVVPDKFDTFVAAENVSISDHLCLYPYKDSQLLDNTETIADTVGGVAQAINVPYAFYPTSISAKFRYVGNPGSATITLSLYACSGTPGTSGIPTGPALFTKSIAASAIPGYNIAGTYTVTLSGFGINTILPAGNYCIYAFASGWSSHPIYIRWQNSNVHAGNIAIGGVANASADMCFQLSTNPILVAKSQGNDVERLSYAGQSTQTKTTGQNVVVQTRGKLIQSGATNAEEPWYMSNTPGVISTTPGTNVIIVGKGIGTNQIGIRGLSDLSSTTILTPPSVEAGNGVFWMRGLPGGGLINISESITLGGGTNALSIDISPDFYNWYTISYRSLVSGSGNSDNQPFGSFAIPRNYFVRLVNTATAGGSTTINYLGIVPF